MKAPDARAFIKEHLYKRGRHKVNVSHRMIRFWWTKLNKAVFRGHLEFPHKIELKNSRGVWGWVMYNNYETRVKLRIQPSFISRELFLTVLVHEMVHAWERLVNRHVGHGKGFFSMQSRIKRTVGLELDKSIDEQFYNR